MTAEHKAKLLVANLGRHMSDETKAKIGMANAGRCPSLEARARMSASGKGRPKSSEWRADMSARQIGSHLSDETRIKLSIANKGRIGSLSGGWRGGINPINQTIRHSDKYNAWRTAVFERDAYTCQDCGARNGMGYTVELEAHHIHEFAQYPDERFVVENGKTLCLECHNKTKLGRLRKARVVACLTA